MAGIPSGTYPSQAIQALAGGGCIVAEGGSFDAKQVQPSSFDLTLSEEGYQLPGSILPLPGERVRDIIKGLARKKLDLSTPTLLDRSKVYLIRLRESLKLPEGVAAYTNNKSSTGRIDLATRVVSDHNPRYDKIPEGYKGELWLEVIPKSFDVIVRAGASLNQAIFYRGRTILRSDELAEVYRRSPLLFAKDGKPLGGGQVIIEDGLLMSLDLDQELAGFVAKKTYEPVDLAKVGQHDASEFFEPIARPKKGQLWLERGRFYIFSTAEYIRVPPEFAVEMLPYDTSAGEFRAHYAGFFDPGFGYGLK
ncbi:MAG: 2'-deoxycytidine 5'-triphosphate deaminase, partial [Planctomycetes bacterium]|nr:2'-deoxycytidine 5'-triphosphate deaminase [Planctomycetota bacterium]